MKIILPVKPISQLFPIPFVMGCEGVSAAMLLQFNNYDIKATQIMSHWPKHPTNPYKGYVGHPLLVKFGHHQTIFPDAFAPFLKQYDSRIVDGTGTSLNQLEKFIDKGQPVIIYHTSLGSKPLRRVFHDYYYYIDPLWSRLSKFVIFPSIIPNSKQIIKIKKHTLENSYNAPGKKCIYIDN